MCTPLERLKEAFEQSLKSESQRQDPIQAWRALIDAQVWRERQLISATRLNRGFPSICYSSPTRNVVLEWSCVLT
jgi:hypothetical protein